MRALPAGLLFCAGAGVTAQEARPVHIQVDATRVEAPLSEPR